MNSELIIQLVSTLGVSGVLVWYLYHTTTKTIPDLADKHAKSMESISEHFTETLKDVTAQERSAREREINLLQASIPRMCQFRTDLQK
jgi:hypothetical protein